MSRSPNPLSCKSWESGEELGLELDDDSDRVVVVVVVVGVGGDEWAR